MRKFRTVMPKFALPISIGFALLIAFAAPAFSVPVTQNIALSGDTQMTSYWNNLSSAAYPGYGSFNSTAAWPGPMASTGTAGAGLTKVSGYGFAATTTLYIGNMAAEGNTSAGTFSVIDSISGIDLQEIAFQIVIGEAGGFDFFNDAGPVLNYNGGSQSLTTTLQLVEQEQNGTFENPNTGLEEPVYVNLYRLVWDVSGITEPITSIDIRFSVTPHSQIYSMRLDEGGIAAVPEPSSVALLMTGAGVFALLRRRKAAVR